jgi:hypothetical protein
MIPDNSLFGKKGMEKQLEYWTSFRDSIEQMVTDVKRGNKDAVIGQDVIASWENAIKMVDELTLKVAVKTELMDSLITGITSLGTLIGDIFVGADEPFKKFAQTILQTAGSIIGSLLGIALAAETVKKGLVVGLIVGLIGVSATLAAISATKEKAANLASGGIIPSGYPNDSFRANLSSNEAVIPLERLPQLIGIGNSGKQSKVEFFIDGRYLKGILEDANVMSKTF